MREVSVLVGGKAGDGIKQAGNAIARLFNRLGYRVFVYEDYPSLIRGGHNFAVIRASEKPVFSHASRIDVLIALNQETVEKHKSRMSENGTIIFDSDCVSSRGMGIEMSGIVRELSLPPIVRNTVALGALARVLGIEFSLVEDVIRATIRKKTEENVEAAKRGYESASEYEGSVKVRNLQKEALPLLTGNEAIALGLAKGGMKLYVAYPMTPASSILHYLAAHEDELRIRTVHPETEIAVIGMLQGAAFAGIRSACGTSGGGFALMVEHLSLAGQAEIPCVIVLAQRPAPATGVPTYTEQGDLFFAMFAGHGEFPRIVLAPGDADEAFYLSARAMNLAWKFQIPVIILADKHLSESTFTFTGREEEVKVEVPKLWSGEGEYKRYARTQDGVSPLAFPGNEKVVVKYNSYEHDERGITTEEPELVALGHEKRLRKMQTVKEFLKEEKTVNVFENGDRKKDFVVITWGSTKGAVLEACERLGIKMLQPLYLMPLPVWEIERHANGRRVICVEVNSTGQLANWLEFNGIRVEHRVLKYDARPFTVDEVEERLRKVVQGG